MVSLKNFLLIILLTFLQMGIEARRNSRGNDETCDCGIREYKDQEGAAILQGIPVKDYRKYPWMVALFRPNSQDVWGNCGGSIISPTFILTAAHCLYHFDNTVNDDEKCLTHMTPDCFISPKDLKVGILGKDTTKPIKKIMVSKIIVNSNFEMEPAKHDIALLELKEPIKCTPYNKPVCIPNKDFTRQGEVIIISGFGKLKESIDKGSKVLQEGTVKKIPLNGCPYKLKDIICIEGIETLCHGDSGSPGFISKDGVFYAVGTTSLGFCRKEKTSAFTNVAFYYDFIKRHVHDLPKPKHE